jgi:hypothetical protein
MPPPSPEQKEKNQKVAVA